MRTEAVRTRSSWIAALFVRRRLALAGAGLLGVLAAYAALPAAETTSAPPVRMPDGAVLVSFPTAASPDGTKLAGSLALRGGQVSNAEGVLLLPSDQASPDGWSVSINHFPAGGPAPRGGLPALSDLPAKGVLCAYEAPSGAEATLTVAGQALGFAPDRMAPGETRSLPGGAAAVQRVPAAACITGDADEEEFPSLARTPDGRLWAAWQAWDGKADCLFIRPCDGKEWGAPIEVSEGAGDYYRPVLQADGEGRLWIVWAQNDGGNWELYARFLRDGKLSPVARLTSNSGGDWAQVLAADSAGRVWVAWQADRSGNWDIFLARLDENGLSDERAVTRHPASDREPALCAGPNGGLVVAWDTYRHGSYDIYLREVAGRSMGKERPVAFSPRYEAHPSLARDARGRVWIAWDDGGPNWGQHARPAVRLHGQRSFGLRCLSGGRLYAPAADPGAALPASMRAFCELPQVAADDNGRVWLLFRHLTNLNQLPPNGPAITQARGIWNVYAMAATDAGWSAPMLLAGSSGRNDQRIAACAGPGGLWIAYAGDGRLRQRAEVPLDHNVFVARLPDATGGAPALAEKVDPPAGRLPEGPGPRTPSVWRAGGRSYTLLLGDTHRHTDISRCSMNYDGSLFDTYRYAQDVVRLGFLAISDHDQDILKHRYDRLERARQDYAWWRSQKYADLCMVPGRFVTVYGYEHGGSFQARGGHKNVLYVERGQPCVEVDGPSELFAALPEGKSLAIPHQLADGTSACDWSRFDGRYERVAEIFQARGSYEYADAPRLAGVKRDGNYYWDAVGAGRRIGIIASSDHGLVHGAYAGVYVEDISRRAVVDALRARRTFGSTEDVRVELRIGDALVGSETTCTGAPALDARIVAPTPIARVDVIRDGRFVYTREVKSKEYAFRYADASIEPGASTYYYVRAILESGEIAWSSPIWVRRG